MNNTTKSDDGLQRRELDPVLVRLLDNGDVGSNWKWQYRGGTLKDMGTRGNHSGLCWLEGKVARKTCIR